MTCDEVRALLPEVAEFGQPSSGPVADHLAGCAACSRELSRYQILLAELSSARYSLIEPSPGFLGRVLSEIPDRRRARAIQRVIGDQRVHRAVLPLGGALIGGAAIGLLWWRAARRALGAVRPAERL